MFADGALVACTDKTVRLQSQFSSQPVYYYYYTHNGEHSSVYVDASPYMVRHGIQWNTSCMSTFHFLLQFKCHLTCEKPKKQCDAFFKN